MTGPIIPADQWPEWADRHCWDENEEGHFYGTEPDTGIWMECTKRSNIPMPTGWDWRVPVMRPVTLDSSVPEKPVAVIPTGRPTSVVQWLGPMPPQGTYLYAAPQSPTFEWARPTNRRQKAVELLLAHGYHWQDGEWVAPAPAIDLEQFREVVSYARSAAAVNTHAELEVKFRSLLTLIDNNVQSCSEHNEPAPAIDLEQFRELLNQWKGSEYPLSYEGQHSQRALNACIADLLALIDGQVRHD